MKPLATEHIYWAAGFLEGEGSFGFKPKVSAPKVQAVQVQQEPLRRLRQFFGGPALKRYRRSKDETHQPIWLWTLNGKSAIGLMMTLYPLMSPRRKRQIRAVLMTWRARPSAPRYRRACPRGHPYDGMDINGTRTCSICSNACHKRVMMKLHADPARRARYLAYMREYDRKNKPARLAAARRHWKKLVADPKRHRAFLAKRLVYYRQYRARKRRSAEQVGVPRTRSRLLTLVAQQ